MEIERLADLLSIPDLPALILAVDERVREVLSSEEAALREAATRVADAGGKRLRPVLTMAVAHLGTSFDAERAVAGGAAVELVQIGSLVHDDLFEQAATRRGVPTVNAVEGDNVALLAGDFILAKAAEQAALVSDRFARLLAATVMRLCEGQLLEMRDQFNVERSIERYLASIRAKTAVLFAAACAAGTECADLPGAAAAEAFRFGEEFGMAYQLVDDVFDFVADPERLGKPVGIDLDTGVYTLPVLLAIEAGDHRLAGLLKRRTRDDVAAARQQVATSAGIEATIQRSRQHAASASAAISHLQGPTADGLRAFPHVYFGWAFEHFLPGPRRWLERSG